MRLFFFFFFNLSFSDVDDYSTVICGEVIIFFRLIFFHPSPLFLNSPICGSHFEREGEALKGNRINKRRAKKIEQ